MRILVVILFISLISFITYKGLNKKEIDYTVMGDKNLFANTLKSVNYSDLIYKFLDENYNGGFYSKDFIYDDIRVTDLIEKIEDNEEIEDVSIQNIINKSELLLINIGEEEINYKLNNEEITTDSEIYKYLDELSSDIDILLKKIDSISSCKIVFLGYYNSTGKIYNDKYYQYINKKIKDNEKRYNLIFIDTYKILNKNDKYLINEHKSYITSEGNMALYSKILDKIKPIYLQK